MSTPRIPRRANTVPTRPRDTRVLAHRTAQPQPAYVPVHATTAGQAARAVAAATEASRLEVANAQSDWEAGIQSLLTARSHIEEARKNLDAQERTLEQQETRLQETRARRSAAAAELANDRADAILTELIMSLTANAHLHVQTLLDACMMEIQAASRRVTPS